MNEIDFDLNNSALYDEPESDVAKPKFVLQGREHLRRQTLKILPPLAVDVLYLTYDGEKPHAVLLAARSQLRLVFKDHEKKPQRTRQEIISKMSETMERFVELQAKFPLPKDKFRLDSVKGHFIFELQELLGSALYDHVMVQNTIRKVENTNWGNARDLEFLRENL